MLKYGTTIIGLVFLVFGIIRLGVSTLLLLHLYDMVEFSELREAIVEVSNFLSDNNKISIISFSPLGYLSYLWLMGALLIIGAIGCLKRNRLATLAISLFLLLYVLLFVNFQTINPKIIHLFVCAALFSVYIWLNKRACNNQVTDSF